MTVVGETQFESPVDEILLEEWNHSLERNLTSCFLVTSAVLPMMRGQKYGRIIPLSWETIINDDLGAFQDLPMRLGRAARRTEEKLATNLFVGASGPNATFFAAGNKNVITGNPALSMAAVSGLLACRSLARSA